MGEMNIEKVDADKFVKPADGYEHGYYGYCPDDTDADSDTVAVQGPLAEEYYSSRKADKPAAKPAPRGTK